MKSTSSNERIYWLYLIIFAIFFSFSYFFNSQEGYIPIDMPELQYLA